MKSESNSSKLFPSWMMFQTMDLIIMWTYHHITYSRRTRWTLLWALTQMNLRKKSRQMVHCVEKSEKKYLISAWCYGSVKIKPFHSLVISKLTVYNFRHPDKVPQMTCNQYKNATNGKFPNTKMVIFNRLRIHACE